MLLSQVIAHKCNIGYEGSQNRQLVKLNDQPIKNLKQLKELLLCTKDPNLVFEFRGGQQIVLDRLAAMESQTQVGDVCSAIQCTVHKLLLLLLLPVVVRLGLRNLCMPFVYY